MKKIIFVLVCIAVMCSCTSNMDRAQELIAEYQAKSELASSELSEMAYVKLTQEQQDYIRAYAEAYAYQTAVAVAKNWQLTTSVLESEAMRYTARAEVLRVPLGEEQQAYASKYTEVRMYVATVSVLKKWVELHQ